MSQNVNLEAVLKMATEIVVAYIGQRSLEPDEVPALIVRVRDALLGVTPSGVFEDPTKPDTTDGAAAEAAPDPHRPGRGPAVPIEKSVTEDFIISLEDGRPYRSLRRHLMLKYGMTPDDYRRKWDLPPSYPMVAPSYSRGRSEVAKRSGLGTAATRGGAPGAEAGATARKGARRPKD